MPSDRYDRNRRFFVAVMLAAIYGIKRFTWREIFTSVKKMFVAMTSKKGKASDELFNERMAICRECPVHFSALNTCGSPLAENPELGCWCHLPRSAREANAQCWLREKTDIDGGWTR